MTQLDTLNALNSAIKAATAENKLNRNRVIALAIEYGKPFKVKRSEIVEILDRPLAESFNIPAKR